MNLGPTPAVPRADKQAGDRVDTAPEGIQPIIRVESMAKEYDVGGSVVRALRGVSLGIAPGEFVAVTGTSGAGKSTFLNLIGCLDRPTSGQYWLAGRSIGDLTTPQLALIRNRTIGFIFQTFHLLPRATALENVTLPLLYAGVTGRAADERGQQALACVGLSDRARHRPNQLSGGQQQRVAIARSLVTGPSLLLADEPTGNLDTRTGLEIVAILQQLNDAGVTILLVTHEPDIAAYCRRATRFEDGQIVEDDLISQRRPEDPR
jgi:putative ABC transport system ATP-binding protein